MPPLVSILIPAYNAERWIGETIQSALAQTWPRKEIIIVDDGSKDLTLAIARKFATKEVTVVTQENQGAASARNRALSICQGDFIQWLDADDLLSPDKISKQMEAFDHRGARRTLLSSAWGHFFYRQSRAQFDPTPLWHDLTPIEWLLRKIGHNLFMQPATWLVSRELTEIIGPWDRRLSLDDDGEYFCRAVKASDGTRFVPGIKTFYRRSPQSLSSTDLCDRKWESQFLSLILQFGHLRSIEDSARVRTACLKCLQDSLIYFYPERPDLVEQAKQFASAIGGRLGPPQLPWNYTWIQRIFGWGVAKRTQIRYNRLKLAMIRGADRGLSLVESRILRQN